MDLNTSDAGEVETSSGIRLKTVKKIQAVVTVAIIIVGLAWLASVCYALWTLAHMADAGFHPAPHFYRAGAWIILGYVLMSWFRTMDKKCDEMIEECDPSRKLAKILKSMK